MKKVQIISGPGGLKDIPRTTQYKKGGKVPAADTTNPIVMNGMMKGKMAYEDAMGNPAAHRMVQNYPPTYTFTGLEGTEPQGSVGTHYMGSYGEYAIPSIQQRYGQMMYVDQPSWKDKEAIRFNQPVEAQYFAEHYKNVAPMMRNSNQYKQGGQVMNKKVRITAIPQMAGGGPVSRPMTQWEDLQISSPGAQDMGSMYTVPQWPGLLHKPPQLNQQPTYQFYNDQINNIPQSMPYAPVPTGMQRQQQDNWHTNGYTDYSVDAVRSMAHGGYAVQGPADRSGVRRALSTPWLGAMNSTKGLPDEYSVKDTIPEAEPEDTDIIVEKDEVILQPTPSGIYAQKAGAGSHAAGTDKGISVSDGAFVFSDTRDLKIKDEDIQKEFNMPFKKSGYTPAKLGGKYVSDLNKFSAMISNPDTDKAKRETAEKMVGNITKKLGKLAEIQEGMKQAMGIAAPGQQMATGGDVNKVMGRYKKDVPYTQVFDPTTGRMEFVPDTDGQGYLLDEYTVSAQKPQGRTSMDIPGQSAIGWQGLDMTTPLISQPTNTQANEGMIPETGATLGNIQAKTPDADNKKQQQNYRTTGFTRPDQLALLNSGLNYANLHKYLPYEPPVTGVIPRAVYMDPTRALAANSEQAGMAYRGASNRKGNDLSTFLAIQGQAGKGAADILGQYSNANTQIANQANAQAAQIQNTLLEAQRNRLKSLHQGNTIAAQQWDNAEREARADLLNVYQNAWKNRQGYDDMNQTSRFYKRDMDKGLMHFDNEQAKAEFMKEVYGSQGAGNSSPLETFNKAWEYAYSNAPQGMDDDEKQRYASKYASAASGMSGSETERYDSRGNLKGRTVKKREMGGPVKKSPNMLEHLRNARGL